jgi:hypothetical protein
MKYNFKSLQDFCNENELICVEDYSNIHINYNTKIKCRCKKDNCDNIFEKTFKQLAKSKNFGCKSCYIFFRTMKTKNTCIERYGVSTTLKNKDVISKIKNTLLEKYGATSPLQSLSVKEKFKNTCLERFGVTNPTLNKEIQEKVKQTCLKKYGYGNPFQSHDIQDKIKEYNKYRYGFECNSKSQELKDKYKDTCLKKYGIDSHTKINSIKEKIKQTNKLKYGCENVMHNSDIMETASKNAYNKKKYIFSSGRIETIQGYENFAIDELIKNYIVEEDIIIGSKNVPIIWYLDESNKKHRHYVDIYIKSLNKCIEVKSSWTFNKKKNIVLKKQEEGKKLGFEYEIWIYDSKGNKIDTIN